MRYTSAVRPREISAQYSESEHRAKQSVYVNWFAPDRGRRGRVVLWWYSLSKSRRCDRCGTIKRNGRIVSDVAHTCSGKWHGNRWWNCPDRVRCTQDVRRRGVPRMLRPYRFHLLLNQKSTKPCPSKRVSGLITTRQSLFE